MERSRKIEEVGDSIAPIIEQNEKILRFNADQGLLISSEPLSLKYNGRETSNIGRFLKNSSQEEIRVDGCNQILWFTFFFDGTGNNLDADKATLKHSNVAKLYRVHEENNPVAGRYRIYIPGVGTYFKEISDKGRSTFGGSSGDFGEKIIKLAFQQFESIMKLHVARENNKKTG